MSSDPTDQPPLSPEEAAQRAADPAIPVEQRNEALRALRPLVEQVARQVAASAMAPYLRQQLVDESFTHVGLRIGQFPASGEHVLENWLRTVLRNLGRDRYRRSRTRDPLNLAHTGQGRAAGQEAAASDIPAPDRFPSEAPAALAAAFRQMRTVLDRAAWAPAGQVDYYAVFLLRLRLQLAIERRRHSGSPEAPPGEVASWVAGHLPSRGDEEARRIRPELPTLGELWGRLIGHLDGPVHLALGLEALNEQP